jgi:hypothetical protein
VEGRIKGPDRGQGNYEKINGQGKRNAKENDNSRKAKPKKRKNHTEHGASADPKSARKFWVVWSSAGAFRAADLGRSAPVRTLQEGEANMKTLKSILVAAILAFHVGSPAHAMLLGPLGGSGLSGEYARFSDSPFSGGSFAYFHLEDFEDHLFNVPGVSASAGGVTSVVFGPAIHDSVDLDDGVLDGSGLNGDSFFSGSGAAGITFAFNPTVLGALPTHSGIVWTDGGGTTTFEAFDSNGISLGTVGPVAIADGSISGTTAEDRFFGVIELGGISAIRIRNTGGGIEVDHLQYGRAPAGPTPIPEPSTIFLLGTGLVSMLGYGWRRRYPQRSVSKR